MKDVYKKKVAVLLVFALLIFGGISPLLSDAIGILSGWIDSGWNETFPINDGEGGGGGWPNGGGTGSEG